MIRIVLDTSILSNPETQRPFGRDIGEAVDRLLQIAREQGLALYMPVSVYREFSHFAPAEELIAFRREAIVRGPDLYNLQVPAAVFHSFIRDLRNRINQGLRVAERAIRSENVPANVRWVREHYRTALRSGIVDSIEDLDVVLLAKEVKGIILASDEGIANMAEMLGIEIYSASDFINRFWPVKKDINND